MKARVVFKPPLQCGQSFDSSPTQQEKGQQPGHEQARHQNQGHHRQRGDADQHDRSNGRADQQEARGKRRERQTQKRAAARDGLGQGSLDDQSPSSPVDPNQAGAGEFGSPPPAPPEEHDAQALAVIEKNSDQPDP